MGVKFEVVPSLSDRHEALCFSVVINCAIHLALSTVDSGIQPIYTQLVLIDFFTLTDVWHPTGPCRITDGQQ